MIFTVISRNINHKKFKRKWSNNAINSRFSTYFSRWLTWLTMLYFLVSFSLCAPKRSPKHNAAISAGNQKEKCIA